MHTLNRHRVARLSAALLAAAGALTFCIGTNVANGAEIVPSHALSTETPFCATQAPTLEESVGKSEMIETTCFSTQGKALAAATDNEAFSSLSNKETLALVLDHATSETAAQSTPTLLSTSLLSVDSVDWHYEGATNYWYGQSDGCDSTSYVANTMPLGWDNVVSSSLLVASGGCDYNWHYENPSKGGASINCDYTNRCYYIGDVMNDRTSSETWG